jgi:hypothetical protein
MLMSAATHAQTPPRSYAVLSLAGNTLALHANRHQVGSRTDHAPAQVLTLEDQIFDEAAIIAARAAILSTEPRAKLSLMMTQDKGLYGAQNDMFERPDAHTEDRDYLKSLLKTQGATHLVLISKFRSIAQFQLYNSSEGTGVLEGMGFYVDDMINLRRMDTQDGARGMLVPFAYVRVRLLDAATLAVVHEATAKQSVVMTQPSLESTGMQLFQAQTSADKVQHMRHLLTLAMADMIPRVLPPSRE